MTIAEMELAADLLAEAADSFGNRCCNDWDWPPGWDEPARRHLLANRNLCDDETVEHWITHSPPDYIVMVALSKMLREQAGMLEPQK